MSIWVSIGDGLPIQYRDNYTGDCVGDEREYMVLDVAVSPGFQPNVRVATFDMPAGGFNEVQLTPEQAQWLIYALQSALERLASTERLPEP
jgi:hypothetical protein